MILRSLTVCLLAVLLLPSTAAAEWGYPPSSGTVLHDPRASASSHKGLRGVDADTDAGAEEWYLGTVLVTPGATPTPVSSTNPLPVALSATGGEVDLVSVGGQPVDVGAGATGLGTLRLRLAADDPALLALAVMAAWTTGAGLADATTLRSYESDDSLLSAGVQAIAEAVAAPAGPQPPSVLLLGAYDGIAVRELVADTAGALTVSAAQLPAALGPQAAADSLSTTQASGEVWEVGLSQIGGVAVDVGAGADSTGTQRTVEASRDGSAYASGTVTQGAGDATVAARAGRRWALVQSVDADGALCVALGSTTNACADCHLLDAAPAAGQSGGTWQIEDWGGAISVCAPDAGTTISYRVSEVY